MSTHVKRKIHFFKAHANPTPDGQVPELDLQEVIAAISNLEFIKESTGPDSRYYEVGDSVIAAWPDVSKRQLIIGRIRRGDLPGIERDGTIEALEIADGAGVIDVTHIQFFDGRIIGAEFNYQGPRAAFLSSYCDQKVPGAPKFKLLSLLRRDAIGQLETLEEVRAFTIRVQPSKVELVARMNRDLASAMQAVQEQYGANSFEITIKAARSRNLFIRSLDALRDLARGSENPLDDFGKLKVQGRTANHEQSEWFDMLNDRLVHKVEVPTIRTNCRRVDPESMFSAIQTAYADLRSELEQASSMGAD